MKKFINDVGLVKERMIQGMAKAYPQYLKKLDCGNVVVRVHKKEGRVVLISGGGNGHEPAHGRFVGAGILDGTVAGTVFISPTPDQIYEGTKVVVTDADVLMAVKNYTKDMTNSEMATGIAEMEDITVERVAINDDVVVKDSFYTIERRGVAGTIFVHKVAGALAEAGGTLDRVRVVTQKAIDNVRTMGTIANPRIAPAADKPGFELVESEVEVGTDIRGEPGTHRETMKATNETVDLLLAQILTDPDYTGFEVAVMTNDTGAIPLMELFITNGRVAGILAEERIKVYKTMVGECMISIETQGFSISLLRLDNELKEPLGAPTDTSAWRQRYRISSPVTGGDSKARL